ncbi:hypothetical protein DZC78_09680 [Olleya aquimaris]|uniref:Uncharacterized protein n=1 Tax=Olleya sediminilitoris TaxID=2795739 RepID=A0ABS1WGX2_9FLAO|nr:hypothetical protein [Olleya sediminilitoris]AXO80642.1 hypothetical protein DZC78_09680 [Olleya aquimaris]MBL7558377.1 hypothetical protein [Olleya sediminilitoris]
MKKTILLVCFAITCLNIKAQKADVKTKEIKATFEQPEFLKNIKTYSYTIQDDGTYWNYTPTAQNPTLASNTDGINLSGLERVKDSADLQIVVGFSGNQLKTSPALYVLQGTYHIMVLNKDNKLLLTIEESVEKNVNAGDNRYSITNRDSRNITKALIVTEHVEKLLKEYEHLFSGTADLKVPFGLFKKTKGGIAESFNETSKPLIDSIISNSNNIENIDKAITYWTEQLEVDFGKKVKDKIKNRVIYANLTSANLLKKDLDAALTNFELVKENTGFFDTWTSSYKTIFNRFESFKAIGNPDKLTTIKLTPTSTYLITLPAGKYTYKSREAIDYHKIEIENFVPNVKSGIASLDSKVKPKIYVYENETKKIRHFGDGNNTIVTNEGEEIVFKLHKGEYKACTKQDDGTYKIYNRNTIIK